MQIVFYDLETTIPPSHIIEFGCVVVDAESLEEIESFETLIYSDRITSWSVSTNGITPEMVVDAPRIEQVAEQIYRFLQDTIWAGHNIRTFDNPVLARTFAKLGRPSPQSVDIIDTLPLARKHLADKVENHKLETLAQYYNLGPEDHRSLSDARLSLAVFKNMHPSILHQNGTEL